MKELRLLRTIAACLVLAMLIPAMAFPAQAAEPLGIEVQLSPENPAIGDTVTMTVSLTGYTADTADDDLILDAQVDVTGVNPNVLTVKSCDTLIDVSNALANKAIYKESQQLIRLVYLEMKNTLPAPHEGLLEVRFQINPNLTGSGSITLPIATVIDTQTAALRLNTSCTINYTDPTPSVTSVDISWGALNYTYNEGIWNAAQHKYVGAGWTDGNSGYVKVKNTGNTDVTAEFIYQTERPEITGSFADGYNTPMTGQIPVAQAKTVTAFLNLTGKPAESLDNQKIGQVTVTIGGE